MSFAVFGHKT